MIAIASGRTAIDEVGLGALARAGRPRPAHQPTGVAPWCPPPHMHGWVGVLCVKCHASATICASASETQDDHVHWGFRG